MWIDQSMKYDINKQYFMLIGNKKDSYNRQVTYEEGKNLADKNGILFFETSAKTGENLNEAFQTFVNQIILNKLKEENLLDDMLEYQSQSSKLTSENAIKKTKQEKIVETLTNKHLTNILFDSFVDEWKRNNCLFYEKIKSKTNVLILITNNQDNIGCFIPNEINQIGRYNKSDGCFIFSLNSSKKYPIKNKGNEICIHNENDEKLLTIGKDDIVLFKEEIKNKSYCKNGYFDITGEKFIPTFFGNISCRISPERIVVFQLE